MKFRLIASWVGLLFWVMLQAVVWAEDAGPAFAGNDAPISYAVDLADSKNHYLTIDATIPATGNQTELMMAVWTPGSYLVREYSRHIDSMEVTDDQGQPLTFSKTRKNRWMVATAGIPTIHVHYRLYCNEMSVRTNWVGGQYAMINGAPTFITVPSRLNSPHIVQLVMPKNWKRSATSLKQLDASHRYRAENFDELVDSPIVAGNIHVYPFVASGVEHQLVNIGESGYWDGVKAAKDLKTVVEEHHRMWGVVPYDRYLFLNMISESGGGLEHDNSTLIMTSRWSFREAGRYRSWLSMASHEFFHAWNIRRLRPTTLVEYDYENEVYTESLWIAEGITSYYQDVALVRAGLIDRNDFLGRLSGNVEGTQRTGGRKLQSLTDSSYDAWIKYYRPDENSSNTQISYYSKGAVAAFLLDVKIRKLTGGEKSLDDVMRAMFEKYAATGYTPQEFRDVASEIAGEDLSDWFVRAIDSTNELDYSDLEFVGISVPVSAKKAVEKDSEANASESEAKDDGGEEADDNQRPSRPRRPRGGKWIGLSASGDAGQVLVTSVTPGSPAYQAGINLQDEILAINDYRVSRSIDSRLNQFEIGDDIELLLSRRGELFKVTLEIGALESENWRLRYVSKPTDEQKLQLDRWLLVPKTGDAEAEDN